MRSLEVEIFLTGWFGRLSEDDLWIVVIDQFVCIVIDSIPVRVLMTGDGRQALLVIQFIFSLSLNLKVYQLSFIAMFIFLLPHQFIELLCKLFLFLDLFAYLVIHRETLNFGVENSLISSFQSIMIGRAIFEVG